MLESTHIRDEIVTLYKHVDTRGLPSITETQARKMDKNLKTTCFYRYYTLLRQEKKDKAKRVAVYYARRS